MPRARPDTDVPAAREAGTETDFTRLLVAIATGQDRDAFATLFGHFAPRVKAYLQRGGASPASAEELAQDTMLLVWRKAASFDPARGQASTWIFTIARNLRIDALRHERYPDATGAEPDERVDEGPGADRLLMTAERERRVRDAVARLPEDQARVIRESFYDDHAHGRIARDLDIPLGTVKSRMRLAVARLRSLLDED